MIIKFDDAYSSTVDTGIAREEFTGIHDKDHAAVHMLSNVIKNNVGQCTGDTDAVLVRTPSE